VLKFNGESILFASFRSGIAENSLLAGYEAASDPTAVLHTPARSEP